MKTKTRISLQNCNYRAACSLFKSKKEPLRSGLSIQEYDENNVNKVGIVRIDVEEMKGKEALGEDEIRAKTLNILKEKIPLPISIER